MQIEGLSGDVTPGASGDRDAAILAVLRPDQRESYEHWRAERRADAQRDFAEIGLKMPEGWDALSAD
jgi:hypothetical protein